MFMRKIPKLHVAAMIYSTLKTGTDKVYRRTDYLCLDPAALSQMCMAVALTKHLGLEPDEIQAGLNALCIAYGVKPTLVT
jgi:hypothetical protein